MIIFVQEPQLQAKSSTFVSKIQSSLSFLTSLVTSGMPNSNKQKQGQKPEISLFSANQAVQDYNNGFVSMLGSLEQLKDYSTSHNFYSSSQRQRQYPKIQAPLNPSKQLQQHLQIQINRKRKQLLRSRYHKILENQSKSKQNIHKYHINNQLEPHRNKLKLIPNPTNKNDATKQTRVNNLEQNLITQEQQYQLPSQKEIDVKSNPNGANNRLKQLQMPETETKQSYLETRKKINQYNQELFTISISKIELIKCCQQNNELNENNEDEMTEYKKNIQKIVGNINKFEVKPVNLIQTTNIFLDKIEDNKNLQVGNSKKIQINQSSVTITDNNKIIEDQTTKKNTKSYGNENSQVTATKTESNQNNQNNHIDVPKQNPFFAKTLPKQPLILDIINKYGNISQPYFSNNNTNNTTTNSITTNNTNTNNYLLNSNTTQSPTQPINQNPFNNLNNLSLNSFFTNTTNMTPSFTPANNGTNFKNNGNGFSFNNDYYFTTGNESQKDKLTINHQQAIRMFSDGNERSIFEEFQPQRTARKNQRVRKTKTSSSPRVS